MREIVRRGFCPPVNIGPIDISTDAWSELVLDDSTDWLLCKECDQRAGVADQKTAGHEQLEVTTPDMPLNDLYQRADEARNQGDFATAMQLFEQIANTGDCERATWAMIRLAQMDYAGEGTHDENEAARWIEKAADHGGAEAMFNIGYMYYHGEGLPKNDTEAVRWLAKAANLGDPNAMLDLGKMYESIGDIETAARWFRGAAANNRYEAPKIGGLAGLARIGKL